MPRSFDIVDDKLREADFFLEQLRNHGTFETSNFFFSAFLSASRSVTFALQASLTGIQGFAEWYAAEQAALGSDPNARWFLEARNKSEKQGARFIGLGVTNPDGSRSHFPRLELGSGPRAVGSAIAAHLSGDTRREEDELDARALAHMRTLAGLVQRCYVTFGRIIDPAQCYTLDNLQRLGLSLEDAEEELGLPRGWTAGIPDEERIKALRRSAPMPQVDDLLLKYVGVDRTGNMGEEPA